VGAATPTIGRASLRYGAVYVLLPLLCSRSNGILQNRDDFLQCFPSLGDAVGGILESGINGIIVALVDAEAQYLVCSVRDGSNDPSELTLST
jgi:hypothetical protein